MCTSPIKIKNRTREFKDGYTKEDMYVPCGHCQECLQMKADSWHLRINEEFEVYQKAGGKVAFVTFTYNPEHRPRFYYQHDDGTVKSFPCFNKIDKDVYIRSLQDYFRYHASYDPKDEEQLPFRFIWASEYGESERGQHCPHYHALFFIPPLLIRKFGYLETTWKKIFRDPWQPRGFVRYSPGNSIFVNSEFAGLYVSKYITKDILFYNQPEVKEYFDQAIVNGEIDQVRYKELRDEVKQLLPNHWQSPFFGASLVDKFDNLDTYIKGIDLHLKSELSKGVPIYHKIPQYIERKLLMKQDENRSYKLTDKGVEYRFKKFEATLYDNAKKYTKLLDKRYLRFLIKDDNVFRSNRLLSKYKDINGLYDYITSILVKVSTPVELYLYNRVWQGSFTDNIEEVKQLDKLDYFSFVNLSLRRYYESMYMPVDVYCDIGVFNIFSHGDDNPYIGFGAASRFLGFDRALRVFGEIYNVYHRFVQKQYNEDRLRRKKFKFNVKSA